jgi:uncharacterized protein
MGTLALTPSILYLALQHLLFCSGLSRNWRAADWSTTISREFPMVSAHPAHPRRAVSVRPVITAIVLALVLQGWGDVSLAVAQTGASKVDLEASLQRGREARGRNDFTEAANQYRRACEGGSAEGCGALGWQYSTGRGVAQDRVRAGQLYRQACDGGSMDSCFNLGVMLQAGSGVEQDFERALALYHRACDGGSMPGCGRLGVLYAEGAKVEPDYPRALALSRRACDAGHLVSCGNLGSMYEDGLGVAKDDARAAALYGQVCDGGIAMGCEAVAELYQRTCDAGDMASCGTLAVMYSEGRGLSQDHAKAAGLLQRACDGGDSLACASLGVQYHNGTGVAQDYSRAAPLLLRACDAGNAIACHGMGSMHWFGNGVREDRARALAYMERSCEGGLQVGCSDARGARQAMADARANSGGRRSGLGSIFQAIGQAGHASGNPLGSAGSGNPLPQAGSGNPAGQAGSGRPNPTGQAVTPERAAGGAPAPPQNYGVCSFRVNDPGPEYSFVTYWSQWEAFPAQWSNVNQIMDRLWGEVKSQYGIQHTNHSNPMCYSVDGFVSGAQVRSIQEAISIEDGRSTQRARRHIQTNVRLFN